MKGYEYQSDFAKKYIAVGRDLGCDEGVLKGRAEERALAVLDLLQGRGLAVPDEVRERVLAEKDPAILRRWFQRALTVTSAAEIFDDPS